jgi:hypothetical protein
MTSKSPDFGLYATDGSPAIANVPVPGILGSFVNSVSPGTNDSGAHDVPPSVENEKPQPSLKCQSFHAPASSVPLPSIPNDSSLPANRLFVTSTGFDTIVVAAPALPTTTHAHAKAKKSISPLIDSPLQ